MVENSIVSVNDNREINEYFDILCNNNFPMFIIKYLNVPSLKRLSGIGQFCGVDYNKLEFFDLKYWYSRLDHSIACACIVWYLTKDKNQTLLALFHDLGTPAFSHCVDFMLKDTEKQESSERPIYEVITEDLKLFTLLREDNINIDIFNNIEDYTIVENKKPKLCVDRLEGILGTCLIWRKTWSLDDVRRVYQGVVVGINEESEQEISFKTLEFGKNFFEGILEYSYSLQKNEDKLSMSLMGDILNLSIKDGIFTFEDLFILTEKKIIDLIKNSNNKMVMGVWLCFESLSKIYRSEENVRDYYSISTISKKRYVNPYVYGDSDKGRLTGLCSESKDRLQQYLDYEDSKYCYIVELDKKFNLNKERG